MNYGISDLLEEKEIVEIELLASKMTPSKLDVALSRLANREISLLRDSRFSLDLEMRDITIFNIAVLIAAATISEYSNVNQDQKVQKGTEIDQDPL